MRGLGCGCDAAQVFFAIRASHGAKHDPARWAGVALEGIRNPSARPTALADTQAPTPPTRWQKKNKSRKKEISQLQSPSALQPRTRRTKEAEEEKEGRREVIISCSVGRNRASPLVQSDGPLLPGDWRQRVGWRRKGCGSDGGEDNRKKEAVFKSLDWIFFFQD